MEEDYIAAAADALSDLTGERALGAKIADDISDCFKLDLLGELDGVDALNIADVPSVFNILGRDRWHDDRIFHKALEKLRQIQIQMQDSFGRGGFSFARAFDNADAWSILPRGMRRHPFHAGIQREAARLFLHIVEGLYSRHVYRDDPEAIEIAGCLVAALRNHPKDVDIQKAALFALHEIVKSENGELSRRPVIGVIAPSGGIPAIFAVLKTFGIATDNIDRLLIRHYTLRLLRTILENDQSSSRQFFHYARVHPGWRETIQAALNIDSSIAVMHGYIILQTLDDF